MADSINASELLKEAQIDLHGKTKSFARYTFWHYTTAETVRQILDRQTLRLTNIKCFNDKVEREQAQGKSATFATCFCNSDTEKIPMWYLYGGLTGNGVRIGFTPSNMLAFINSINEVRSVEKPENIYRRGSDFELVPGWVFYKSASNRFFYRNRQYLIPKGEEQQVLDKFYFIKEYPWEYEREFRIVVTGDRLKKRMEKLEVDIPDDVLKKLKVCVGPEFNSLQEKNRQIIAQLQGYVSTNVSHSSLKCEMFLLKRFEDEIRDYCARHEKEQIN